MSHHYFILMITLSEEEKKFINQLAIFRNVLWDRVKVRDNYADYLRWRKR